MPKFSYKNRIRHRHVFTSDSVLLDRLAENKPLTLVGNHFSEEPYGFGVPKGDEKFLQLVNLTLQEMAADGTLAAIYFNSPFPNTLHSENR